MAKTRLDTLLAQRGLFPTRSRAAASVLAGEVRLGTERRRAAKPGQLVAEDVTVSVAEGPEFVSRGGRKLANALAATGVDPAGRRCLDVGASTGGFTDCLLQAGAAHVVAVDVAYGELAWGIRGDDRVTVMERANARHLRAEALPYAPDLIVVDVSFIGLAKVLPAVLACAAATFEELVRSGRRELTAGRAEAAAAVLAQALRLWRGPVLGDVRDAPFVQAAAVRLEELRDSAVADRFDAELQSGRYAEILVDLEAAMGAVEP